MKKTLYLPIFIFFLTACLFFLTSCSIKEKNPFSKSSGQGKISTSQNSSSTNRSTTNSGQTSLPNMPSDNSNTTVETPVSNPAESTGETVVEETPQAEAPVEEIPDENSSPLSGGRSKSLLVLVPEASGTVVYGNDKVTIDASHTSEGYIMVNYHGSSAKVKLQITLPNSLTYTYTLHSGYETFPLTGGDGSYKLGIYENISGDQYATAYSVDLSLQISNSMGPYLYPNQYVNYSNASNTIQKSSSLSAGANTDLELVEAVYNYITSNFSYDYDLAANVKSGYLPDVDSVYAKKKGICFDYAAVMATMLRVQQIPTRMEIGYVGDVYHAWISVYISDVGWINGIIQFHGDSWTMMDPTMASTSSSPKNYIPNQDRYTRKYIY